MLFIIGEVFPYIAVTVFVTGMTLRVIKWLRAPVPFQLTLFPAPKTSGGRVATVLREMFFFSSLRRGGSEGLWFWSWIMHVMLVLIIAGHVVGIYYLTHQFTLIGLTEEVSSRLSASIGTIAGIGFFMALVVLLYRRLTIKEVKYLSDPADYFDIILLLSVVVTGMMMRVPGVEVDLASIRTYLGDLIMLSPTSLPDEWFFIVHFSMVNLLLVYFPFSKLVHMAGFFVSRSMLVEAAPVYPTPKGAHRDTRVLKEVRNA